MQSRRQFAVAAASVIALAACGQTTSNAKPIRRSDDMSDIDWKTLSEAEWRERLSPEAFTVLRKAGTERPGSSALNGEKRDGIFACAGCGQHLFTSAQKYESGTGWPSFFDYIDGALETKRDFKLVIPRTEYHCSRCGGHHGHVFKDGPKPTGLRYCNNGVALEFIAA